MGRDKEFEQRMQGMSYAYDIAKKDGIEGLEREIRRRNITKIPMSTNQAELKRVWDNLCQNMYNNITACFLYSLKEEFHFGKKRTARLIKRYTKVVDAVTDVDYMGEHYIRLEDYAYEVNEKLGMNINIERVAASQEVYDEKGRDSQYHTANIDRVIEKLREAGYKEAAEFLSNKLW